MSQIYKPIIVKNHKSLSEILAKKIIVLLIGLLSVCMYTNAQVTVLPATTYTSLNAAFAAINAGTHTGAISINITASYTEPSMAVLNSSGTGAANYTSVNIKPTGNFTITGNFLNAIIKLNGADNVTIDGAISGTTRNLTIINTLADFSAAVIWVASASATNGATNNVIKNCNITGSGSTTNLGGIMSSSGATITNNAQAANSNNTYQNNNITSCWFGMWLLGATANDAGNIISQNSLSSLGYIGIDVTNQQGVTVSKNTISGIYSLLGDFDIQSSGIYAGGTISGGLIEKNKISDIKIDNFWGSNGIQLESTSTNTGLTILNNFIWDIASGGWTEANTIDDNGYGIAIDNGGGYKIYYNTIDLSTNQTRTGSYSASLWISEMAGNNLDIRDNIFSNRETTFNRFAVFSNSASSIFSTINYNDYYCPTGSTGFLGTVRTNLAAWQTATGQDANSLAIDPSFTSTSDLHLQLSSLLNASATPIVVTTNQDIDDQPRNATTPDIGADEFTPVNCTINTPGTISVNISSICGSGSAILSSTGFALGDGLIYQWQYSNDNFVADIHDLVGQLNPNSGNTGTISATTYYRLKVTCAFFSGGAAAYSNKVTITVTNPQVLSTTPASRCGTGIVNLGATSTGTLKWYANPTGGVALYSSASPSTFTTPPISATTTYYVSSTALGSTVSGGKPSTNGADGANVPGSTGGIFFTATQGFTLNSVVMYPTAAGTNTIVLYAGSVTTGTPIFTTTYTFTGANPFGVTVPINWSIPAGNYTIYQSIINADCWRDGSPGSLSTPATAYPYNIGGVCTLTNGSLSGYYYFFYNWSISTGCEGTRLPVTATVTAPPVFTSVTPVPPVAAICAGTSINLNASGGGYTTYTWNPGNLVGASQSVSPATTTVYTLTAESPTCRRDSSITITVNPSPSALTITPSAASICSGTIQSLVSSGGTISNVSVLSENFNGAAAGWVTTNTSTGGDNPALAAWTLRPNGYVYGTTTFHSNDNSQFYLTNSDEQGFTGTPVTNTTLRSPAFSLVGFSSANLSFWHYYRTFSAPESINIEGSTDGASWTNIQTYTTAQGASTVFANVNLSLAAYLGQPVVYIRFRYNAGFDYFWAIDNVNITGTGQVNITWSPSTELYKDAGATMGYAGEALNTTWTKPTVSHTYTATATGPGGCTSTATSAITVISSPVSVSIVATPGNSSTASLCVGGSISFLATPTNGGATPAYNWYVNGIGPVNGASINPFVSSTLVTGDVVTCRLSSSAGICALPNPAISNAITVTVNPAPTVTISSNTGTNYCNGVTTTLTANASVSPGSISTYEWFLGGISQGLPSGVNTFTPTAPGSYTVNVMSVAGCSKLSAAFVLATQTYTINASAGANGTISPAGAVLVDCGNNQLFTFTPNAGYSVCDVLVDGLSVGTPASYTFTNVTANGHTIAVTFCIAGCATPPTAFAGANTSSCANVPSPLAGTIGGSATSGTWTSTGDGTFSPDNSFANAVSYIPGPNDILNAPQVIFLTLTTNDPDGGGPCIASSSVKRIALKAVAVVSISGFPAICPASNTTLTANATFPSAPTTFGYQWFQGATPLGAAAPQVISAAGNYSVTVTAVSNGCPTTEAVVVTNSLAPTISVSGAAPICTGSVVTLTATATAGSGTIGINSYQWKIATVDIGGETTAFYAASSPGSYTVSVTNSNGCTTTSTPPIVLASDNTPLNGSYTIGVGPASCTNYVSFATAINDLNNRSVSGNVRFDIPAGYTETVPALGLKLGSVALNAAMNAGGGRTLIFNKSGSGANPKLTSYIGGTGTPATASPDGIWSLRGIDNVTINSIDLEENAANTTNPSTMEYGYGLFKWDATDGARNNSILNCKITLNKINSAVATAPMLDGSVGILVINATATAATTALSPTTAAGSNSNNRFVGNIIQNCHQGIGLSGFNATTPFTAGDTGNDIGGTSLSSGNSITNFGNTGDLSSAVGVNALNQWTLNVSYNTISNGNATASNAIRGIFTQSGTSGSVVINNNTITLLGTGAATAIDNGLGSTAAGNTVDITSNIISGPISSSAFTGINNSATAATVNINSNTIQNITFTSTGIFTGISSAVAATNLNISSNTVTGITKVGAGTMNCISEGAATNATITNNNITNNTITGGGVSTLTCANVTSGAATTHTFSGNTINNNFITAMTAGNIGTVAGYVNLGSTATETANNNIITNLYVSSSPTSTAVHVITGIRHGLGTTSTRTVTDNTINNLYTGAGISGAVTGILSSAGGTINISKNKIYSLLAGQNGTSAAFAKGISIQSGTTAVNISNNMISLDQTSASVLTGANAVNGIDISNQTTVTAAINIYYNSIRLAGGGSGTTFGSSALNYATGAGVLPPVDLRNNIIDNLMTPGSGGLAVAFRRNVTVATGGYAAISNNNLFYAGAPGATHLLYYDGTNSYQTIGTYTGGVGMSPRETKSLGLIIPAFVSATDLHIAPGGYCDIDGTGTPIVGYTDDIDAVGVRDANLPDIGFDEFTGTGTPTWRGLSTDWMNVNNWCGVLPTNITDVVIPNDVAFYPVITGTAPVARNISIGTTANVVINAGGVLNIKGLFANSGTLTNNGKIILSGTTLQTFPGSVGTVAAMDSLEVNNAGAGVSFDKAFTITGALLPTLGTIALNNNNITLASTATKTASVGVVGTTDAFVYGGTGRFIVQRFIPAASHGKSWQFMATPTKGQTVNQAWMEGATIALQNPNAGFGTQITSNLAGATTFPTPGFDVLTPAGPSMKTYDPLTAGWIGIANTGIQIANPKGYMLFVRGDRSVSFGGTTNNTTLRTTGKLYALGAEAPATVNILANKFESVGNPYASTIDFTLLSRAGGTDNKFYVWDPTLSTPPYFLGGYQTISSVTGFVPTPGGTANYPGSAVKVIQSGQAFFVFATGSAGTLSFTEAAKASGNSMVFKPVPLDPSDRGFLKANLYTAPGNNGIMADGNIVAFDDEFVNDYDDNDALKIMNSGENFGILKEAKTLSVEARKPIADADTIFYTFNSLRKQTYEFRFVPEHLIVPGIKGYLVDKFLDSKTDISLTDVTNVSFDITDAPASYAADRFMLVFKKTVVIPPVKFVSIKAIKQDKNIQVDWKIGNELNISHYDLEKSADGTSFNKVNEQDAKGNGTLTTMYNWLDANAWSGDNFYRVRSVAISGEVTYSDIVKVNMPKVPSTITVFPNPVQEDRKFAINFTDQPAGEYKLIIVNPKGQQIMSKTINHAGGNNVYMITMDKAKSHGNYLLTVTQIDNVNLTFKIVY